MKVSTCVQCAVIIVYVLLHSYWIVIWHMWNADLTPREGRNSKINSSRAGSLFLASFFSPGSPVLGSLSPTQTSEPARRLLNWELVTEKPCGSVWTFHCVLCMCVVVLNFFQQAGLWTTAKTMCSVRNAVPFLVCNLDAFVLIADLCFVLFVFEYVMCSN